MRAKFCFCLLLLPLCLAAETVVSHYHRVQPGETLSTISKRYNISLSLLMKQNNLSSTSVQAGQRLLVQKKTLEVTGSASQKSAGRKKRRTYSTRKNDGSNPAAGTSLSYYTVKRGDSLATISRKTGVSVSQIKRLNGLKGSLLTIGQRLKIKSSPVFVSPEVQPRPILPGREKVYYRVQAGDTLESIAEQFGIPAETLRESNLLEEGVPLKKNQVLVIPPRKADDQHLSETVLQPPDHQLSLGQRVVEEARRFLDTPYRLGGEGWMGVDCSGLVRQAYKVVGLHLPATSQEQFCQGQTISLSEVLPGDLLFFSDRGSINHVGIYLGNNDFIHASSLSRRVTISSLSNDYFARRLAGIRRYLTGQTRNTSLLAREEDHADTP